METDKNRIPDAVKTIHLIAVCGTGMGALAAMLVDMGFSVTGSDHRVYPPMSEFLARKGIRVNNGFAGRNLSYGPDLVIVGNAVTRDNPEARMLETMGLPYCSMPQAVNRFAAKGKKAIVITGTHGKTTTSAIVAWILCQAGLDPSFMVGGILKNFDSNYRLGNGEYLVIEGDEYDTAFFDKGPKFLHYCPAAAVLTSVEFDHADIFNDLDHVRQAFANFIAAIPPQSPLMAYDNDRNIDGLVTAKKNQVFRYGRNRNSAWRLGNVSIDPPWTRFEVFFEDKFYGAFKSAIPGEHNLLNTLSAIAVSEQLNISRKDVAAALASFGGVRRRQEVRGIKNGITVIDDFAHHPTAVRETIRALKPFCIDGRLISVFEPRTNTSMRKVFQDVYPLSFEQSDLVCIRQAPLLEKIPEAERFSSRGLVEDLKRRGLAAYYFADTDAIIDFLLDELRTGDVVLIMSNGGFDNIHARLLEAL